MMGKRRGNTNFDELFEDLMQYTDFDGTEDIKNRSDLYEFFKQVREDSEDKGRRFIVSKPLFQGMAERILDLKRTKREIKKKRAKNVPIVRARDIRRMDFQRQRNFGILNQEKVRVFKTTVKIKGKTSIRWRDSKGRFRKSPE